METNHFSNDQLSRTTVFTQRLHFIHLTFKRCFCLSNSRRRNVCRLYFCEACFNELISSFWKLAACQGRLLNDVVCHNINSDLRNLPDVIEGVFRSVISQPARGRKNQDWWIVREQVEKA